MAAHHGHQYTLVLPCMRPPLVKNLRNVVAFVWREYHRAGKDLRSLREQSEDELGDDAEVAAAAADTPEEVGVVVFGRGARDAIRGHDCRAHQVVDREPVCGRQPAVATAKGQSEDMSAIGVG